MSQVVFDGASFITPEAIANAFVSSEVRSHLHRSGFEAGKAELAVILSMAQRQFEQGKIPAGITADLHNLRDKLPASMWQELIPIAQEHPVSEFFLQDPFTRWSFEKPRGYSGDAHLLDFIYGHPSLVGEIADASSLGRALYEKTRNASSSDAVRERRDLLTLHVDGITAARGGETEILAIAGGHLREARRSIALEKGHIRRWVALDQDPLSVGSIARDFPGMPVEALDGSVRGLLTNAYQLGRFDFVYAAGLYDYLPHKVAVKLTQSCLQLLKPDGIFLFANFSPEMTDDGYMETFMNWALLQRSEEDMWAIINASVDRNCVEASVYFGSNRNIVYAVLRKRQEIRVAPVPAVPDWTERFEAIMEPMDGWLVWDNLMDLPAEQAGLELFGLSHPEALMHCRRLNGAWPSHRSMSLS